MEGGSCVECYSDVVMALVVVGISGSLPKPDIAITHHRLALYVFQPMYNYCV